MMRRSKNFEARWQEEEIDELLVSLTLNPGLRTLVEAPFVRRAGGLLLEPLVAIAPSADNFQDRTGYEAFINKIHVDDFLGESSPLDREGMRELIGQGVKAAFALSDRLQREGNYRIILSLDVDVPTMTLRFFERRDGEPWGADEPDAFQFEEVMMIDTSANVH
jgi:hypothetical protein